MVARRRLVVNPRTKWSRSLPAAECPAVFRMVLPRHRVRAVSARCPRSTFFLSLWLVPQSPPVLATEGFPFGIVLICPIVVRVLVSDVVERLGPSTSCDVAKSLRSAIRLPNHQRTSASFSSSPQTHSIVTRLLGLRYTSYPIAFRALCNPTCSMSGPP